MRRLKNLLVSLAGGSMELCWMYVWAAFCSVAVLHRPFPFLEGVCSFLCAIWVSRLSAGKGWRVVAALALHALVFAMVALRMFYITYFPEFSFVDPAWFSKLFAGPGGFLQWVGYILVFLLALMFWIGGVFFERRPRAYFALCSRLDIGLVAFFCLFVLKLIMVVKGGVRVDDPASGVMIFPFFLFSFFAIGMVRLKDDGLRAFLPRYRGASMVAGFAVTVMALGGGLILFFMSGLSATAHAASRALRVAAGASLPYMERLLHQLFSGHSLRPEATSSSPTGDMSGVMAWAKSIWWIELLEKTLGWTFAVITGTVVLATMGMIILLVVKWLLSRSNAEEKTSQPKRFLLWIRELLTTIGRIVHTIRCCVKGHHRVSALYGGLRFWGGRCGLAPAIHETPLEFGGRLQGSFPQLAAEINLIVGAYIQETYGEKYLGRHELDPVFRAWRRLHSPLFWPARLKVRLLAARDTEPVVPMSY